MVNRMEKRKRIDRIAWLSLEFFSTRPAYLLDSSPKSCCLYAYYMHLSVQAFVLYRRVYIRVLM